MGDFNWSAEMAKATQRREFEQAVAKAATVAVDAWAAGDNAAFPQAMADLAQAVGTLKGVSK